ncbi:glycosyltransferase family 4 protein [Vibrio furnissii]|uniref:glycosyltransferase family 4 protein n=1 Tax=Vibrio TaxID=662 RepID=UPI00374889B4
MVLSSLNDKFKLVFIVNVDWYFNLHWMERANYFKSLGFDIYIVGNFSNEKIKSQFMESGFKCYNLFIKRNSINIFNEVAVLYKIRKILKIINPHIIHCITVKPNIYAGIVNKLFFSKPIIYSITGTGSIFSSSSKKFKAIRIIVSLLYKSICTGSSRFIFENSDDYKLFNDIHILKDNGVVIKGAGIDVDKFIATEPNFNRSVLFAARLLKDKGLYELVEAKKVLAKRGVNFILNVAGIIDTDVSYSIPMQQIKNWEKDGSINWLGPVIDMPNLISMNDIVCLPTMYGEGVPRILIEAASCQRAIVTTDVAGCREIVSHDYNGYLVTPNDPESLANCIEALIVDSNKLVKFGKNGRKKVEKEFSQEIVFEKTLNVYQALLGV